MLKSYKIRWEHILCVGILSLLSAQTEASAGRSALPKQVAQCQVTLKKVCLRLEEYKGRTHQAYYDNLYRQSQDFLNALEKFPVSSKQLTQCENFITIIGDIIGTHPADLAPMPSYTSPQEGRLSNPMLETAASRVRWKKESRLVRFEYSSEHKPSKREDIGEESDEEGEEIFPMTSHSPRTSKLKTHIASEEPKKLE